jgi:hypothetical protein
MKFHLPVWWYQYWCFNILLFNQFLGLMTFLCPKKKKSLCFSNQFSERCHKSSKVFYKTFVKLCHLIEYLNLMGIHRWWHVYYWLYFFGFGSFPSLETIKANNILQYTINAHLSGFIWMPYSLHFWKLNLNFYKWLSMSLYIIKSSINIFIKLSQYSLNVLVIAFWYVGGPF